MTSASATASRMARSGAGTGSGGCEGARARSDGSGAISRSPTAPSQSSTVSSQVPNGPKSSMLDRDPARPTDRDEQVRRVVPDVRLVGIGQVEPHPGRAGITICHVPFARERGARRPLVRRPEPTDRIGLGGDRGVVDEARSRREQRAQRAGIAIGHEHVDENLERLHHAPFRRAPRITEGNRNPARLGYGPGP